MQGISTYVLLFLVTLVSTVLGVGALLPLLRRRHAGQYILEIGPAWHAGKAGTPTMGGLAFAAVLLLVSGLALIFRVGISELLTAWLIFLYAALCGCIGLIDDLQKLRKKENAGLSAAQKYLLQLLVSAVFLYTCRGFFDLGTAIRLPFSGKLLELGSFYYPLALLFLTGVMNAANLTDGVDGLLSSVVLVISLAVFLCGWRSGEGVFRAVGAMLGGASLGFLLWNRYPARLFMGDTGSLCFGGALAALGIVTGEALLLLLFAVMPLLETLSVILQVVYYKLTGGRRLFRMAPFHHHLEKSGLSETQVVALFCLITTLAGGVGVMLWHI